MMKNATWKIMELQRERMFVVCCFVAVAIISTVQGQLVDVEPRNVTALEGESINLLCRWGQPLQYCRIQIPGEKILVLSPQFNNNPEYKYYGAGLEEGQCGVTINQIKGSNDGNVTCNLGSGGTEHDGFISLTVARPPLPPEFEIQACSRSGICEVGNTFTATCISRDGRPAAQLQWYFDGEPIQSGLGMVETVQSMAAGNTSLYTATQTYTRVIQSNDDRKYLTCQTPHITDRGQPPQQVQVQLQVRYAPRSMQEVGIYGLTIGQTALINVTIQANPRPRTEWFVDSMPIPEGTQNGRYEAYEAVDLGNGMFNATLAINSLTLQDTVNPLRLRASNEFGSQDYTILISSQEEASILDVGSIVGIVVGLVVLLIAVVLLIVARVTGRWCFAGKSSLSTNNMSNETSDTESGADVKTTKLGKFHINLPQLFKRKPNQQKQQRPDGTTADDGADEAVPSEATVIVEDEETPQKSEKNLVYAELMLKPSSEVDNPNSKNTTEYAEIVYVTKADEQKQLKDDTQDDKQE